jgi:hypothetical protein
LDPALHEQPHPTRRSLQRASFPLLHLSDAIFPLDRNTAIPWKSNPLPCRRHANDTETDVAVSVLPE